MRAAIIVGLTLAGLTLGGCAPEPEPASVTERTSVFLEASVRSQIGDPVGDTLAAQDWFDDVATDLVSHCATPSWIAGYLTGFDDEPVLEQIVRDGWAVACE